jgi:uncharacterized protein YjbJ (UPF0337 family)
MKSSKRDRVEGALYKVGGRILEAIGSLIGSREGSKLRGAWAGPKVPSRREKPA